LDLDIGWHSVTGGKPSSYPGAKTSENKGQYNRPTGTRTIDITGWAKSLVDNSNFGGIVLGSNAANNLSHYGYMSPATGDCKLQITYRRWE
jgi:hypothetical protein